MVIEDLVDLNLTISPSSRKIPALLTKKSAQPCQTESCLEIMWIWACPTDDDNDNDDDDDDDDDDDEYVYFCVTHAFLPSIGDEMLKTCKAAIREQSSHTVA